MSQGTGLIQTSQFAQRIGNFIPSGTGVALSCSGVSSAVEMPVIAINSIATDVMIINNGSVSAFIAFGSTSPTAVIPTGTAANGICIPAGAIIILANYPVNNWVAGITASSTTTLYFYQGAGS